MILKTRKRDLIDISFWRLITLLNCLGKGLKRLLVRKIALKTVWYQVVAKTYFGVFLKRLVIDLVACFILDVEEALNKGKSVAALFLDIKGAFNIITYSKLLRQLYL